MQRRLSRTDRPRRISLQFLLCAALIEVSLSQRQRRRKSEISIFTRPKGRTTLTINEIDTKLFTEPSVTPDSIQAHLKQLHQLLRPPPHLNHRKVTSLEARVQRGCWSCGWSQSLERPIQAPPRAVC